MKRSHKYLKKWKKISRKQTFVVAFLVIAPLVIYNCVIHYLATFFTYFSNNSDSLVVQVASCRAIQYLTNVCLLSAVVFLEFRNSFLMLICLGLNPWQPHQRQRQQQRLPYRVVVILQLMFVKQTFFSQKFNYTFQLHLELVRLGF